MSQIALVAALFGGGIAAGVIAALLGIGGGVLNVPLLTLVFGVPVRNALGASLVAAIATSDATALWPHKRRLMDAGLAWALALASTFGATLGATVALAISPEIIQALFALLLLYVAYQLTRPERAVTDEVAVEAQPAPGRLRQVAMWLIALFAGASSGLLGIGGGVLIVPGLNLVLRKPFKVSTATSNLLVGLTALTGAFTFWAGGALLLVPTVPLAAGAFVGALIGSVLDRRVSSRTLRWGMALLLTFVAVQLGAAAVGARLGS